MYNTKHTLLHKSDTEMAKITKTPQYLTELYYCAVTVNTLTYILMDSNMH